MGEIREEETAFIIEFCSVSHELRVLGHASGMKNWLLLKGRCDVLISEEVTVSMIWPLLIGEGTHIITIKVYAYNIIHINVYVCIYI